MNMYQERISHLKTYNNNVKTHQCIIILRDLRIFFQKSCNSDFQTCEKSLQYHTCTELVQTLLMGNGNGPLYLKGITSHKSQPKHLFESLL